MQHSYSHYCYTLFWRYFHKCCVT